MTLSRIVKKDIKNRDKDNLRTKAKPQVINTAVVSDEVNKGFLKPI